jgi:hypothetical protein
VEPDYVDDEERLYSDVVQNLRWACCAENQDEAEIDASMIDDREGEEEDLPPNPGHRAGPARPRHKV